MKIRIAGYDMMIAVLIKSQIPKSFQSKRISYFTNDEILNIDHLFKTLYHHFQKCFKVSLCEQSMELDTISNKEMISCICQWVEIFDLYLVKSLFFLTMILMICQKKITNRKK